MNSPTISRPDLKPIRSLRKLIVAHSDQDTLEDLANGLVHSGFDVLKSSSGIGCVTKLRQHTTDVLLLDPDLLWGGGDGVLNVMASSPRWSIIPVILLVSPKTCSETFQRLKSSASAVITMPSLQETITERCIELAEWKIARSSIQLNNTWSQTC